MPTKNKHTNAVVVGSEVAILKQKKATQSNKQDKKQSNEAVSEKDLSLPTSKCKKNKVDELIFSDKCDSVSSESEGSEDSDWLPSNSCSSEESDWLLSDNCTSEDESNDSE